MAADVLAHAEQLAVGREEPGRVQPAGRLERGLRRSQPVRELRDERGVDAQVALDARRLDGDGLERALAADAAGGGGVEAALQAADVGAGRVDVDRVRGQIVGSAGVERPQPLREAEAERELLVVAGGPHRHRDGHAGDPDLERLLDGDDVIHHRARHAGDLDARRRVRERGHLLRVPRKS